MIVSWNWLKEYVRLDMPVEIVYHKMTDEITLPLFQPAGA